MDEQARAALLIANAAAAMIEAMGLAAENQKRIHIGEAPVYHSGHFLSLIDNYGIDHNAAISTLQGR
jgi:hypothetical protein